MEIKLTSKPKNPIIIEGFPGLGLIGTICTEYLIKHLDAKSIGTIWSDKIMPIAAMHEGRLIQPLEIFYSQKHNIVIIHAITDVRGIEWELGKTVVDLAKQLGAKQIISLEGLMGQNPQPKSYFYTNDPTAKQKMTSLKVEELKEGIVMGITAAIMLKNNSIKTTGIFAETASKLPDSRSAAKIIEILGGYLNLNIDVKPLLKAAKEFEGKLKGLMEQTKQTADHKKAHDLSYLG